MKKIFSTLAVVFITQFSFAQESTTSSFKQESSTSPYEWDWVRDGIWTGGGIAVSGLGLYFITEKDDITEAELQQEIANKDDINFLDRWVAGNHSEDANKISDIPFALSFATPLALLFDDEANEHSAQIGGLYLESLATTASLYTMTAAFVNRSRPYVYDESGDTSLARRTSNNGQRSFYSGHVAAAATATFFTAKVFTDFNPDMNGKFWIWTGAATIPATVGYFRLEAGQHFLTDVLLGYGLGAAVGYFVPELHKVENDSFSVYPTGGRTYLGDEYSAMAVRFTF
ncbi:phosphatase PAP2 family protein [Flavobacteriaceae bacterium TK19130]|nr:phosphatase PAP2 family protein [Thermobacterium salinum]